MKNTNTAAAMAAAPTLRMTATTIFRNFFCRINAKRYICSDFHTDRRVLLVITGIFCAHAIRFCTPVWCVNAPTAYQVEVNGKGRTVFNFCLNN